MQNESLIFEAFGQPREVLQLNHGGLTALSSDELRVQTLYAPINPSDLIPIYGNYAHRIPLPSVPGYEGVGVVVEVGQAVDQSWLGERVLPLRGEGTWQKYVSVKQDLCVKVPDSISDFEAAQFYINPVTAWVILREVFALRSGSVLLVNACGSMLGRLFVQMSQVLGIELVAVVRNNRYSAVLKALGASHVIDRSQVDLHEAVGEITQGRGADAAIDSVGGDAGTDLAMAVRRGGIFLTLGLLSGQQVNYQKIATSHDIQMTLFHLRHWNAKVSADKWQNTFEQLFSLVAKKQLEIAEPAGFFKLPDFQQALGFLKSRQKNKGKIIFEF